MPDNSMPWWQALLDPAGWIAQQAGVSGPMAQGLDPGGAALGAMEGMNGFSSPMNPFGSNTDKSSQAASSSSGPSLFNSNNDVQRQLAKQMADYMKRDQDQYQLGLQLRGAQPNMTQGQGQGVWTMSNSVQRPGSPQSQPGFTGRDPNDRSGGQQMPNALMGPAQGPGGPKVNQGQQPKQF